MTDGLWQQGDLEKPSENSLNASINFLSPYPLPRVGTASRSAQGCKITQDAGNRILKKHVFSRSDKTTRLHKINTEIFRNPCNRNYSGMLIGLPIAIMYVLARKITAEGCKGTRDHLTVYFPSASLSRTLRLNSRFGYSRYSIPHVIDSPCIVKSPFTIVVLGTLSSYI